MTGDRLAAFRQEQDFRLSCWEQPLNEKLFPGPQLRQEAEVSSQGAGGSERPRMHPHTLHFLRA